MTTASNPARRPGWSCRDCDSLEFFAVRFSTKLPARRASKNRIRVYPHAPAVLARVTAGLWLKIFAWFVYFVVRRIRCVEGIFPSFRVENF